MTIRPNDAFRYIRADEVAECWEGVSKELYAALWNKVVAVQKEIPNIEDNGPADVVGYENLAEHWGLLTEVEQTELNALAVKNWGV